MTSPNTIIADLLAENQTLKEVISNLRDTLVSLVSDVGGCEHEAGVCCCREYSAILLAQTTLGESDYGDCFEPNAGKECDDLKAKIDNKDFEDSMGEISTKALYWKARDALLSGYSEDSLKVIRVAQT